MSDRTRENSWIEKVKRFLKRKPEPDPDDPYSLVRNPKKPKLPQQSAAVAVEVEK